MKEGRSGRSFGLEAPDGASACFGAARSIAELTETFSLVLGRVGRTRRCSLPGALVWRRRQAALEAALIESRRRNALANARNALSRATDTGADSAVAAADAILSYISDRLDVSLTGLTSEALDRMIRDAGIPQDVATRVGRALAEGEAARFTPDGKGTAGTIDHVESALRLLTDLEEALES